MAQSSLSRRQLLGSLAATTPIMLIAVDALAGAPIPGAQQPHMQAAKDSLAAALAHLQQASPDKGGHRVAAIKATQNAIDHVEKGIRFDRRT